MRWLDKTFDAPREACRAGAHRESDIHRDNYALTANVYGDELYGFEHACKHGHLNIVRWFVEERGITREDVMIEDNSAIKLAVSNSRTNIVAYLVDKFHIDISGIA